MKVLLAENHEIVRYAVKNLLLNRYPEVEVTEATNSMELESIGLSEDFDIIITEISLLGENVISCLKKILKKSRLTQIIVLSTYSPRLYAARLFKIGVGSYITKDNDSLELMTAVKMALIQKRYIAPNVVEFLVESFQSNHDDPYLKLSLKEFEIFKMIAMGKAISEIAALLSLSSTVISTYRCRILKKMGVSNNYDIIQHAISHGIGAC